MHYLGSVTDHWLQHDAQVWYCDFLHRAQMYPKLLMEAGLARERQAQLTPEAAGERAKLARSR